MQRTGTLSAGNPVPCERLVQVSFDYVDFDGHRQHDGRLIVLDAVAPQVQAIVDELLRRRFPLRQAKPLEVFAGDDQASMLANNSSAFNGRPITGGGGWSKHAYGVAIDINPMQNPYLSQADGAPATLLPTTAAAYVQRTPLRPGMAEPVRDIFFNHGFLIWGGNWHQPIDYQHFEIGSRHFIAQLVALKPAAARRTFAAYAQRYHVCMTNPGPVAKPKRSANCARLSTQ